MTRDKQTGRLPPCPDAQGSILVFVLYILMLVIVCWFVFLIPLGAATGAKSWLSYLWRTMFETNPQMTFKLVPVRPNSDTLKDYIDTGNRLKISTMSRMETIEAGVTDFVDAVKKCTSDRPAVFCYLNGSSGLGKTQLAFALKRKVLYIPLGK